MREESRTDSDDLGMLMAGIAGILLLWFGAQILSMIFGRPAKL